MSQSRLLPAWRPIGTCDDGRCRRDGCNQNPTFDSEFCYYDLKFAGPKPLIAQNGAESRSTPQARAAYRTKRGRPRNPERAATLRGGFPRSGTQTKYPYDSWFDGRPHVLVAGEDFSDTLDAESLQTRIYRVARSRGYDATISKQGATIVITPKQGAVA